MIITIPDHAITATQRWARLHRIRQNIALMPNVSLFAPTPARPENQLSDSRMVPVRGIVR